MCARLRSGNLGCITIIIGLFSKKIVLVLLSMIADLSFYAEHTLGQIHVGECNQIIISRDTSAFKEILRESLYSSEA